MHIIQLQTLQAEHCRRVYTTRRDWSGLGNAKPGVSLLFNSQRPPETANVVVRDMRQPPKKPNLVCSKCSTQQITLISENTMEATVYHGVMKQGNRGKIPWCFETMVNHGMPYNCHIQYRKKHGLPQFAI